ncbi:MAG: hypothetical protein Q4C54_07460 [Clostridia bacterium]|nr:hypothetical protein [Clostridia bacterium]
MKYTFDSKMMERYAFIVNLIPEGEENAVSMRDLARALQTEERKVRQYVEKARADGLFICSGDAGYFLPADDADLIRYYRRHHARLKTSYRALLPLKKYLGKRADAPSTAGKEKQSAARKPLRVKRQARQKEVLQ